MTFHNENRVPSLHGAVIAIMVIAGFQELMLVGRRRLLVGSLGAAAALSARARSAAAATAATRTGCRSITFTPPRSSRSPIASAAS